MNCFQKLLSSWWRTTVVAIYDILYRLWIAFKNYYLRDEGQLIYIANCIIASCELLSKIIIFVMKDNGFFSRTQLSPVVNCFQKLLSSWWRTTRLCLMAHPDKLWIAFKNYYLRDEGQLLQRKSKHSRSCELLSKIIIFVMKDN